MLGASNATRARRRRGPDTTPRFGPVTLSSLDLPADQAGPVAGQGRQGLLVRRQHVPRRHIAAEREWWQAVLRSAKCGFTTAVASVSLAHDEVGFYMCGGESPACCATVWHVDQSRPSAHFFTTSFGPPASMPTLRDDHLLLLPAATSQDGDDVARSAKRQDDNPTMRCPQLPPTLAPLAVAGLL